MVQPTVKNVEADRIRTLLKRGRGKNILVVGAGVTGRAVAQLLTLAGYLVTVIDERETSQSTREEFRLLRVELVEGFNKEEEWLEKKEFSFAILSPGIALESKLCEMIGKARIPRVSEIDLGVAFLGMPEIAVTGTNGKTTTVHLIHQMLTASNLSAKLVGNVGFPFVSLIEPQQLIAEESLQEGKVLRKELLVAEVSSYQLESAVDFAPHVAVWLNIDDDHLERHGSMEQYLRMKGRIFSGQTTENDWSLVYRDDPCAAKIKQFVRGKYFSFGNVYEGCEREQYGCFFVRAEKRILLFLDGKKEEYSLQRWSLLGTHNLVNCCAAIAASRLIGATQEGVQLAIDSFRGLSHRLEVVRVNDGVIYINDSKATNVSATCAALHTVREEFQKAPIVLLLGGQAKAGSLKPLQAELTRGIKAVLLFGGSREYLFQELQSEQGRASQSLPFIEKFQSLEDAVEKSKELSSSGDVVLLAPACASFDAFKNYAQRGERFCELVCREELRKLQAESVG